MKVLIYKKRFSWMLHIHGQGVDRWWIRRRLIDVIDIANTLGVHVQNIQALPLTQYLPGGSYGKTDRRAA